jgi:hypothetical protein
MNVEYVKKIQLQVDSGPGYGPLKEACDRIFKEIRPNI